MKREDGLGETGLAALLHDRATMEGCAACVGWRTDGSNFACPLAGHAEARASASLYWNDNGELVFRDWHKRSGKEFWTLSEVYAACVSGRIVTDADGLARTLAAASMATWSLRLLIVAKRLEPYPVALPPLPDDASPSVVRLYDGLTLLFGAKWAYEPGRPTMFTRSFAVDWCGVGEKTAWLGTRWLLQRRIIVPAGTHRGRPVYLPGGSCTCRLRINEMDLSHAVCLAPPRRSPALTLESQGLMALALPARRHTWPPASYHRPAQLATYRACGCGHGGTRHSSTSRRVHTRLVKPAAIAGVQGRHCFAEPVPLVGRGWDRGWRKLTCGRQKL